MEQKLNKTEQLLHDIFQLCDKTVWLDDFKEFQLAFEGILKKRGYNLWKIYFGVNSEREWKRKFHKSLKKYQQAD